MIKLNEFIKEALCNIINGIKAAQFDLKETGCKVVPSNIFVNDKNNSMYIVDDPNSDPDMRPSYIKMVKDIDFDISIEVQNDDAQSGKFSINVASVSFGKEGKTIVNSNTTTSKLKFSIPVAFPSQD